MITPHDQFCVLPWVSLETSPIGTVRPCCLAEHELVDNAGEKFNLAQAKFTAIQDSDSMRKLRQQFLAGERPDTCGKCWREEDAGRTSKRMHTLDRLKHMIPDQEWTEDARPLVFLDLKLGSICNLKCRICGSWSSSTFATEELQALPVDQRRGSFHHKMLRAGAWPRENESFWAELDQVSDQIRYIEFTGGEPFMIQEHFDLLHDLIAQGIAGQIEIHYNTNGTQWPEQGEEIWRYFKKVEIAFSIDDVGTRFEYQRSNAVWTEVCANIERFEQMRNRCSNIELQVCSTVNIFNVWYLAELADWIDRQQFDFVYWNMMHDAPYFSIANLAPSVKTAVIDRLAQAQVTVRHRQEFDRMIDFVRNGTQDLSEIMLQQIQKFDQRRGQDLDAITPEWSRVIGYHDK